MYRYKTIFLYLISLLLINACSPVTSYNKIAHPGELDAFPKSVMGSNFDRLLYKADIRILDNYYTGLFFIKNDSIDNRIHIVALSEFGLSFLDMEYHDGEIKINNIQSFLDRRSLKKDIQQNFKLLFINLKDYNSKQVYKKPGEEIIALKVRNTFSRYYYFCDEAGEGNIYSIVQRRPFKRNKKIFLKYNDVPFPKKIVFSNNNIRFRMELDLLEVN